MIFKDFKVLGILLLLLVVFAVGGKKVSAAVEDGDIQYTIGVVVYNQDSPEMNMFMNSYRKYIALTGGSSAGNYMHLQKTIGVLKALAEKKGLTYSEDVEKLAYTVEDVQKRMEENKQRF